MKEKIIGGYYKLKEYWSRPPRGYQVTYKEIACFTAGVGGTSFMGIFTAWIALAATLPLMNAYFRLTPGLVLILGWVGAVITLFRSPLISMIIDNHNSPKGKFKPFLLWPNAVSCISYTLIPFIPSSWMDKAAFSMPLPAIPYLNETASVLTFSWGVLAMFVLLQMGISFAQFTTQALAGIQQTITTNSQERTNINSVHSVLGQIPSSVINTILPIVAVWIAGEKGQYEPLVYRIFFPICAVGAFFTLLLTYLHTEERAVLSVNNVAKVSFSQSLKALAKNKYFWLMLLYNIFLSFRGVANFYQWICMYSIGGSLGSVLYGILSALLGTAYLPALLLGPMVYKKIGKKKAICFGNLFFAAMCLIEMLVCRVQPYIAIVCIYGQNFTLGIGVVTTVMTSDALDYEQYKSGLRLEGAWQSYSSVILTVVGLFTAILSPLFLSFAGVGLNDEFETVFQNKETLSDAYFYYSLLGLIGAALASVPFFFWDLDEKKHADIVRVLHIRAAEIDLNENVLTDDDILQVKAIMDEDGKCSEFLQKHIDEKKEVCLKIAAYYPEAKARRDAEEYEAEKNIFLSNLAVEEKRMEAKLLAAGKKAEKTGEKIDEEQFRNDFIAHSRFIKDKEKYIEKGEEATTA